MEEFGKIEFYPKTDNPNYTLVDHFTSTFLLCPWWHKRLRDILLQGVMMSHMDNLCIFFAHNDGLVCIEALKFLATNGEVHLCLKQFESTT